MALGTACIYFATLMVLRPIFKMAFNGRSEKSKMLCSSLIECCNEAGQTVIILTHANHEKPLRRL